MSRLPPAILAARPIGAPRSLPMPPVRALGPAAMAVGSRPKMEILPPAILAARPIGAAPVRDVIEIVEAEAPKKKKGRPSKKEQAREARAAASENIAALLDSEPSKADIRKYFESRIKELEKDS